MSNKVYIDYYYTMAAPRFTLNLFKILIFI